MLQERLIRLADDHQQTDHSNAASVEQANVVADTIRELLMAASEIELLDCIKFDQVRPWIAFYVLEAPSDHSPTLIENSLAEIKRLAAEDGVNAAAAQDVLKKFDPT